MTFLSRAALIGALHVGLMFGLWDRPQAADGASLADALHQLDDNSNSSIDWLGPSSPWRPYLHRQFADGLTKNQQMLSETYQSVGACEAVMTLELKGFLILYPQQTDDILDPRVLRVFETDIVPRYSHAYRRCIAKATLIAILEPVRRAWIRQPDWGMMNAGGVTLSRPQLSADDRTWTLYRAMLSLAKLALCESYRPALKDIVDYVGNRALNLLPRQIAVVKAAAHRAAIETVRLDIVLSETLSDIGPVERARFGKFFAVDIGKSQSQALVIAEAQFKHSICIQ